MTDVNMKKIGTKVLSQCNYCKNLVSINKLHECKDCNEYLENALKTKLKYNGVLVVKNKKDLDKQKLIHRVCEGCCLKIRDNKYLCPEHLLQFHKNHVKFMIEDSD